MAKFTQGNPGKPKGAQNHLTKTVRETVLAVFNELQGEPTHNLKAFAKKYPRDFYQIAAKLIPQDMSVTLPPALIDLSKVSTEALNELRNAHSTQSE